MLQLQTKPIDICRISKLLIKYNLKASITDSVITFDGEVSEELLTKLCNDIHITVIQNFVSTIPLVIHEEIQPVESEEIIPCEHVKESEEAEVESSKETCISSHGLPEYDLIYPEVKRGQVYWCDLGEPYLSEGGGMRPVIVVSKDIRNSNSRANTVIVVPCSTTIRQYSYHYTFVFSKDNMIDYHEEIKSRKTNACADLIHVINKKQLREYIGTMTEDFMQKIQDIIDDVLSLKREVKTIVRDEKVYVDRHVSQKEKNCSDEAKERKDVNMVQVQLLSFVDINELLKISQSYAKNEIKVQRILELFGFDFKKNGVEYLLKAIIASPKDAYFNLETLSESVSKKEGVDKEEVKRLIVARIKERFSFKKAPTIDFIRLVNIFLTKQEALL